MRNFVVTIDGTQYQVGVEEVGATASVAAPVAAVAPVAAPVAVAKPAAPKAAAPINGAALKSPMPGTIKKLCVADGATVKKGEVVLVLEAMKMDNDIPAESDGVISFKVAAGSNVDTGAVLAVIG